MKRERNKDLLFVIFLVAAACATFWRAFHAGYVAWDDDVFVLHNPTLSLPFTEALKASFSRYYLFDYLPLTIMSYWAENHFFGLDPGAQHTVNLGLHCLNIVLLYWFLSTLPLSWRFIRAVCFLFALHPVQTEPIMWVSNRNLFIASVFFFGALLCARKYAKTGSKAMYAWIAVFYGLSYLGKAVAILLPAVLIALDYCYESLSFKRALRRYGFLFFFAAAGAALRFTSYIAGEEGAFTPHLFEWHRLVLVPVMALNALGLYLKMLVYPVGLSIIYPQFELTATAVLTSLAVAGFAAVILWKWRETKSPDYVFFSVFILALLAPVLHLVPRLSYVNDRYLYLPIIGFTALILALARDFKWTSGFRFVGYAFCFTLPILSEARSQVWTSNLNLWKDTAEKNPESALSHNSLGAAYQDLGRLGEALKEYDLALHSRHMDSAPALIFNNIGVIYGTQTSGPLYDPKKAEFNYREGLKYTAAREDTFDLRFNLGGILMAEGRLDEARGVFQELRQELLRLSQDQKYAYVLELTDRQLARLNQNR